MIACHAHVRSPGTFDPKVITEGTLAYALVFPSGFKAVLIGSAGPIDADCSRSKPHADMARSMCAQ
jgi:hypothetical protein